MRKLMMAVLLGLLLGGTTGCLPPAYSGDPSTRVEELLYTSENFRNLSDEWRRFWFLDQPDHMSPLRTHGGII